MAVQRQVKDVQADESPSPVPSEAVAPVTETGVGDSPAAKLISDDSRGTHVLGVTPDATEK